MEIKALVTELEQVKSQADGILDEFKGKTIPAEKRSELDTLHDRAMELKAEIEAAQEVTAKAADFANLASFLDQPQYRVPRGVGNGDGDTKSALKAAGWEIKSGLILAPTSLGQMVEMFPEEVLFGEIPGGSTPSELSAASYFKSTRAAFQPGYRQAYMNYLRNAVKSRNESMAFTMLSGAEQKALSEGSDTAGGFLVPPDVQAEMLIRLPQKAIMRRFARVVPTSRDVLKFPRVEGHATDGSIYSSGFVGDWVGETPAFTDTDPKFGTFDIAIKKIRVATKLSNDFVSDSAVSLLSWLAQNGAENMGLVEDKGFVAGLGTPLQPKGILESGASTVDLEGSTSDTISNTTASAGSAPKLIDLSYALPSQYVGNARWIVKRATEGKIRKLVDGQGRYHWPLTAAGGFGATPRDLLGFPVENCEFVPADGTNGNKVAIFGDLSAYVIANRAQITTVVLRERFADTDQIGLILFERVGGDTWNPDALRIGTV